MPLRYSIIYDCCVRKCEELGICFDFDNNTHLQHPRTLDDIYVNLDVSIFDLILWWEYEINHPTGKISVKIPKWTQMDEKIKISGKGFGSGWLFSKRWDLYVVPKVKIPKKLSKDQEKLWQELKQTTNS